MPSNSSIRAGGGGSSKRRDLDLDDDDSGQNADDGQGRSTLSEFGEQTRESNCAIAQQFCLAAGSCAAARWRAGVSLAKATYLRAVGEQNQNDINVNNSVDQESGARSPAPGCASWVLVDADVHVLEKEIKRAGGKARQGGGNRDRQFGQNKGNTTTTSLSDYSTSPRSSWRGTSDFGGQVCDHVLRDRPKFLCAFLLYLVLLYNVWMRGSPFSLRAYRRNTGGYMDVDDAEAAAAELAAGASKRKKKAKDCSSAKTESYSDALEDAGQDAEEAEADGQGQAEDELESSLEQYRYTPDRQWITVHKGRAEILNCHCTLTCKKEESRGLAGKSEVAVREGFDEPKTDILGHPVPDKFLLRRPLGKLKAKVEYAKPSAEDVRTPHVGKDNITPKIRIGYSILTSCRRFRVVLSQIERLRSLEVEDIYVFLARCNPTWLQDLGKEECQSFAKNSKVVPFQEPLSYSTCGKDRESVHLPVLPDLGISLFPVLGNLFDAAGSASAVSRTAGGVVAQSLQHAEEKAAEDAEGGGGNPAGKKMESFFHQFQNALQMNTQWKDAEFRMRIYQMWVLGVMFLQFDYAVFLQDNLELSPKLPDYMQFSARVMQKDNSLLGSTAWNLLQVNHELGSGAMDPNLYVLRQSHFSNIAWMTSRDAFVHHLHPYASLSDWSTAGEWAELMRLLVRPNRILFPPVKFDLWGDSLRHLDKALLKDFLAPKYQYEIHDYEKDPIGLEKTRLVFFLPSVSLVKHVSPNTGQTGKTDVNTMVDRASQVAFWSLDQPITFPDNPELLTAWRYDKHYLEKSLLGVRWWTDRQKVYKPDSEKDDHRGYLARNVGDFLVYLGVFEDLAMGRFPPPQMDRESSWFRQKVAELVLPRMHVEIKPTEHLEISCARISCESRPRHDDHVEAWAEALHNFSPGGFLYKLMYKGTIFAHYNGYRWWIVAQYSPWWQKFCV
ncbi:unnamed protein product [Amoebophrya sp. A120]|nr:unnamed protein product [Amoebophrya sp. A120]|eukprot:GSA120T00006624001.1